MPIKFEHHFNVIILIIILYSFNYLSGRKNVNQIELFVTKFYFPK